MQADPVPTPKSKWIENRWARVGIRMLRTYLQGVVGFLAASPLMQFDPTGTLPALGDALGLLKLIFVLPLPAALMALLQNTIEELNHIDPGTATRG